MSDLLPSARILKVSQAPGPVFKTALARLDYIIIVSPDKVPAILWKVLPDGARLKKLAHGLAGDKILHSRLPNPASTGLSFRRLSKGEAPDGFELLKFAGKLVADALTEEPRTLGVMITGFADERAESIARAMVLAAAARSFEMPTWQSKPAPARKLRTLRLLGLPSRIDLGRTLAEADAANLARWLTALPPNKLDASAYRKIIRDFANSHGWKMEFFDEGKLRKLGAGAFLAVSQGNPKRDAGIVRLRYEPAKKPGRKKPPRLALVGKGIIFDTGGNNLKPFKSMLDMHEDMGGSAVALATLKALTEIEYPFPVDCWLAITENRLSPEAYKSRDIVTASNGVTIEIIHTDAEGRMVLADALALAGRDQPALIFDYATLTGACVHALSSRYSGVFTNRADLNAALIEAGVESGERVWPFPMDADFEDDLKSKVADISQCSTGGEADHILAARFLQRFVPPESAWVHVDLSAVSRKEGLAHMPSGTTGFGVRFTLSLLLDHAESLRATIGDGAPVPAR
jgi:leucyl aminopeptidase